jgi:hypothetical protein
LNLTYLAPDLQPEIVGLEAIDGLEPMSERPLRLALNEVGGREAHNLVKSREALDAAEWWQGCNKAFN